MQADPREWTVVIDGRRLTSFEELVNLLHEAGFRISKASDKAVLDACEAIPDVTLSKWACNPGGYWDPVLRAVKAARAAVGFNVDADLEQFDHHTGWLLARRRPSAAEVPSARAADDLSCGEACCATQHAPAPDYRSSEES